MEAIYNENIECAKVLLADNKIDVNIRTIFKLL